jgi:hypothetical protein
MRRRKRRLCRSAGQREMDDGLLGMGATTRGSRSGGGARIAGAVITEAVGVGAAARGGGKARG